MKIGIDARFYGPEWGGGGLGRYVEELTRELQTLDTEHRFVLFLTKNNFDACEITNPRFEKVLADVHWYTIREQMLMPKIIAREEVDLMHYPHWNVPIFSKVPFVVTIHDLILLEDPSSSKATHLSAALYALKRAGFHKVLRHAVENSRHIITVSNYVKKSILHHFDVPMNKISVVYEGVTPVKAAAKGRDPSDRAIKPPYFLYVGSAYPHKNLESLLHAFSFFQRAYPNVRLVLVGKHDMFYEWLKKEIDEINLPKESVVFTGFVPDAELTELYEGAALYLFPSRIEGFGLPPLEAMTHGVPVAAADAASLPEVLGDAAIYFDPDNIEQMVGVMEKALTDETLREELKKKGKQQAKKYSWNATAKETLNLYGTCSP